MAENGRTHFTALGQSWSLQFDINAFCRIESELAIESVSEFQEVLKTKLSFTKLRTLFCCGLEPAASEEQAGKIMTELGVERASAMLTDSLQAAFPNAQGEPSPKGKKKTATAGAG